MLDVISRPENQREQFLADVLHGLAQAQKTLPSRWLYDDRGSALFEEITQLEEYYPTRTETGILRENASDIARFCGANAVILEYGAGAGIKTEILIDALQSPRLYVPIDIAAEFLHQTAARLRERFPALRTKTVVADFTTAFSLPAQMPAGRRIAFFPGSTIGNMDRAEVATFLQRMRRHVGASGRAVIGVDLKKDLDVLLAAYDDAAGVTAEFDLNLLLRINRELLGDFVPAQFRHEARWNEAQWAVEMHLVSQAEQTVRVAGRPFRFARGETIHTESSRKYDLAGFSDLAVHNGWKVTRLWGDAQRRFALFGLQ